MKWGILEVGGHLFTTPVTPEEEAIALDEFHEVERQARAAGKAHDHFTPPGEDRRWHGILAEHAFDEWCDGRVIHERSGGFNSRPDFILRGRGAEVKSTTERRVGAETLVKVPDSQPLKRAVEMIVFVAFVPAKALLVLLGVIGRERWLEAASPGEGYPYPCHVLPVRSLTPAVALSRLRDRPTSHSRASRQSR